MPLHSGRRIRYIPEIYETPRRKRFRAVKFLGRMGYNVASGIAQDSAKFPIPNYGDAGAALLSGAIHKLSGSASSEKMPGNLRGDMDVEKTPSSSKRGRSRSAARNSKASKTSSSDMSSMTSKSCSRVMKAITNTAELDAHKRSTPAHYRLHSAKYLQMDAMLKQLFFPLHRFRGFFGFTSTSGCGYETALPQDSTAVGRLAPRGAFRGISFFKLRHTSSRTLANYPDKTTDDGQSKVLNAERISIGTSDLTGATEKVFTYFRKFNNSPSIQNHWVGAAGNPVTTPEVTEMSDGRSSYRQLAMDFNASDIERISLAESTFIPLIPGSTGIGGGGAAGGDPWAGVAAGGQGYDNGVVVYNGTADNQQIFPPLKDAVIRIADGKLSMDIANGTRVPTVVELVIHSMKKQTLANNSLAAGNSNSTWNTKQIYSSIWKAANWQHQERSAFGFGTDNPVPNNPNNASQSGWNTFWDPKTPFLKVSGPGKKLVDNFASEVHRSVHYLAPGESKTVNIALGSLYYKIGGRSSAYLATTGAESEDGKMSVLNDGAGTLAVAVGHFGIDCLETAFKDDAANDLTPFGNPDVADVSVGSGFWVGKRPAPSQIVVSGEYQEQWYPSYMDRPSRYIASGSALSSSIGREYKSVPLGTIAPEQVSTISGDSLFESIGAGKAAEAVQHT